MTTWQSFATSDGYWVQPSVSTALDVTPVLRFRLRVSAPYAAFQVTTDRPTVITTSYFSLP